MLKLQNFSHTSLNNFFNPSSAAVIGASNNKSKIGGYIFAELQKNRQVKAYPINLKRKKIQGKLAYPAVSAVKKRVDLCLIAIPAQFVISSLKDCIKAGVKNFIIISAGFQEIGPEGKQREKELKELIKKHRLNVIGPNCLGIQNPAEDLNLSFARDIPLAGGVALVSQSGATINAIIDWSFKYQIGFSKIVSLGNMAGITDLDLLNYLKKDKKTEAIVFYLETLQNGQEFGKALRDVSRTKPVIIIKPGHTSLAKKAIGSHTGSLAQDHLLAAALIRENNGILVNSLGELFNALVGLRSNYSNKNKLVILTNAGGPGVIATDYVANTSFQLAKLNPKDKKRFNFLPPESSLENPIDMLGDAKSDRYAKALQGVIKLPQVDNVLVLLTPQVMTDSLRIAEKIVAISKKTNKNIFSSFLGNQRIGRAVEFFNENKFANFTTPAEALGAMDYLVKYKRFRYQKSLPGLPINKRRLDNLKNQLSLQKGLVNFELTRDIMNAFGIKLPAKQLIQAKADIKKLKLLSHKKYVLKIDAKKVIHKKDMGAVVTEITKENVQKQALAMFKKASKLGKGAMLTLEEQYDGREVIAGLKIDPNLGNFILFGLGGTYVEVIKDINFALCPINNEKAKQVVAKSKAFEVLQNFRGAKAINFKQLYQFLVRASYLQILLPEIKEVDFNPVICNERGIYLVDVKIIV